MSAYITKLDMLGFDGGTAAWTSKVNTVEEGGGGGVGAMSSSVFTLDTSPLDWGSFVRVESAAFINGTIRLHDELFENEGWPSRVYHLRMDVTSEFAGRYPDSVTVHFVGCLISGEYRNPYQFYFEVRDQSYELGYYSLTYDNQEFPNTPLDIEFTIPLTYRTFEEDEETPYTSEGLVSIVVYDQSTDIS